MELHNTCGSDGDLLTVEHPSLGSQDRHKNKEPSIRQRLRKWRKEKGDEDTIAAGIGSLVQLPALNSIGAEGISDKPILEEDDDDSNPLRVYQSDLASSMTLQPGDAAQLVL